MRVRSEKYVNFIRSRPAAPCAQCGKMLSGPEWSEYLNNSRIRHLWMCSACGYDFETLVVFPADTSNLRDDEAA